MKNRDLISGLFWVGVGMVFCVGAIRLGLYSDMPGPGLFPFIGSLILMFLSTIILTSAIAKKQKDIAIENFFHEKESFRKVSFLVLALCAFLVGLEYLGFLIITFLFMAFLLRYVGLSKWIMSLTVALLTTVSLYTIFVLLLNVRLPRGIFSI